MAPTFLSMVLRVAHQPSELIHSSEIKYSSMLVERGESAANALDSGDYLLSSLFTPKRSKCDFASFGNDAIHDFKESDKANPKHDITLHDLGNAVDQFMKRIGSIEQTNNDRLAGEQHCSATVSRVLGKTALALNCRSSFRFDSRRLRFVGYAR